MLIKQSESTAARRTVYFTAVNTADDSAYTSTLSGSDIMISKAGGSEAASAGTATHIATGLFKYELTTGECDTLGELSIRLAKAGVYNDVRVVNIVAFDPYNTTSLGLTNVDATVSSRLASSDYENLETMLDDEDTVETGLTLRGFFKDAAAALFGETANGGTQMKAAKTAHKVRITSTVSGNDRTSVTTDET